MHYSLVIQVFCYLFGTFDLGITILADSSYELVGYINSDYAGLIDRQNLQKVIYLYYQVNFCLNSQNFKIP